jgi:hypothetical protein
MIFRAPEHAGADGRGDTSIAFSQEDRALFERTDWAVQQSLRMTGVELHVDGDTDGERAASFVKAMIAAGLATKM